MARFPSRDFVTAVPEAEGVLSRAISRMVDSIYRDDKDIHSMLIWRSGKLLFEHYFSSYEADTPHSMFSCSKTFTSMLIGIAQGKGLLSIQDKVLSYFPDIHVEHPNDHLLAMTLEHLLMMGSGHGGDTFDSMLDAQDGDWARVFLNLPVEYEPGTLFSYNTGATYMLSAVLTRITGKSALELAKEWIFEPIGIDGTQWDACPKGISMGGTGLHLKPRDMLCFGILMLSDGFWEGRQIIPRDYLKTAQLKKIDTANPSDPNQDPNWSSGYCYQMWRCAFPAFRADGMGGQFIVVLPEHDMVVVFTSALGTDTGYPLTLIQKYLLPDTFPSAQTENREWSEKLKRSVQNSKTSMPSSLPREAHSFPFGKCWRLPDNKMQISSLCVHDDRFEMHLTDGSTTLVSFAWDVYMSSNACFNVPHRLMNPTRVSILSQWKENSIRIKLNYIGEPLTFYIYLTPEDTDMHVRILSTQFGNLDVICAGA